MHALVFQREELPAGFRFAGPAIIEQYDTTSFVTPGFTVTVDEFGNLVGEAAMANDKILIEVLNNHFNGIVEEMGYVIHRAAYTVFVKETWDFDTSLITREGEIFCHPRNIGVGNMIGIDMGPAMIHR